MFVLGIVLLILAAAVIAFGLVLYGNGVGAVPDDVRRTEPHKALSRIRWSDLFSRMRSSVSGMTDSEASRVDKLTATGSFCVLVGLVLILLAILAFLVDLV